MQNVLVVIHLLIALALVGVILLQRSEGGALGIGGSGGGGGGLFTGRAAGNLLTRITAILGTAFFITSLVLALMVSSGRKGEDSIVDGVKTEQPAAPAVPSAPVAPAAPVAK